MKNKTILIVILITAMILSFTGCIKENKEAEAAIVNGEIITISEFEENYGIYKNMYEIQYGPDIWTTEIEEGVTFEKYLKENILETMIFEKMMVQEATKNNISITDEEVEVLVQEYKDSFEDEAAYNESLTTNGLTEDFLRRNIKSNELIQKFVTGYMDGIDVNEDVLKTYYEENQEKFVMIRASHILVNSVEESEDILNQLKDGADFATLAMEKSIDTTSAVAGGDLGYFPRGQMVQEFEDVAFSLEIGEISQVVPSTFGFHIIMLTDKQDSFESSRDQIMTDYKNFKYNEWVEGIESASEIERKLDIN
ncbi:MAG: peptidylprolyl isomerase [Tissierellales bacterium]|nr:peptidylprolyl isomerase [Tissierellales bacterium]MBN2826538.1 peptidylprolyl isomerase [Tissierellales bacterium]